MSECVCVCVSFFCFLIDLPLLPILSLHQRGEAVDVRTEPESMLTPKHEFSLTDDTPVENAIVPWDLCRSISTSTSTDKSEIQEVKLSKTVASPLQPQSLDEERHIR